MPYKDDLEAAHNRIRALEQKLRAKTKPKEKKVEKCKGCNGFLGEVVYPAVWGLSLFAIVVALWTSHGTLGKCYIENSFGAYDLVQELNWGWDHEIGSFKDIDSAIEAANKLKCPLNHEVK